jgi:hypothetical protein
VRAAAVETAAAPSSALDLCGSTPNVRSSPLGADMVCKSGNSFADALFTQGLMALMQPIICCVRAQSAREFVTEFSGGATPHRSGVAQTRALSSRPKLTSARQPHSRLMLSVHVGGRLADSAAKLHSHHPGHFKPHPLPFN